MVRLGVMSDMSIKSAFPEFQAPNVALASAMDMIVLQKHELTGMRLPKDFIRKKISRFPINDIANYSTLSNVDNVSKTVYASTQGYRKKLGSSNIDREDRQSTGKFKLNERMMPMKYSENFELKRRGGFVDVIDSDLSISQEQLVSNLKQMNKQDITSMNKQIRNSQIGLAKVESNMNSAILSNLENAKVNAQIANEQKIKIKSHSMMFFGGPHAPPPPPQQPPPPPPPTALQKMNLKIEQMGLASGLDAAQIINLQATMLGLKKYTNDAIQDEFDKIINTTPPPPPPPPPPAQAPAPAPAQAPPPQQPPQQPPATGALQKFYLQIEKMGLASGLDATQIANLQATMPGLNKFTKKDIQEEIDKIQTAPAPAPAPAPAQAPASAPAPAPATAPAPAPKPIIKRSILFTKYTKTTTHPPATAPAPAPAPAPSAASTSTQLNKAMEEHLPAPPIIPVPVINPSDYYSSL